MGLLTQTQSVCPRCHAVGQPPSPPHRTPSPHHQTTTGLPAALSPRPIINFPSRVGGVSQSRLTNRRCGAHTPLHGVLPVADNVHTDVSEVVSLLKNTGLVVDFLGVSEEERGRAVERWFVVEDCVSTIAQVVDVVLAGEDKD